MARVLVADDDADIRELVGVLLGRAGHQVTGVADGRAALDQVLADPPDLVVLDLMMPAMTGLEVCAALRERPATASLPVLLLTARALEVDISEGLSTGADDYVVKPFSPRELTNRVQALLVRSQR